MSDIELLDEATQKNLVAIDKFIDESKPKISKVLEEQDDESTAVRWREVLSKGLTELEKRRTDAVKPFLVGQRKANAIFRDRQDTMKLLRSQLDSHILKLINKKDAAEKAKNAAEKAISDKAIADAEKEAQQANSQEATEVAEEKVAVATAESNRLELAPPPTTKISAGSGMRTTRQHTGAFIITDVSQIPVEYMDVAEGRIRSALRRNQELVIPGIKLDNSDAAWTVVSKRG